MYLLASEDKILGNNLPLNTRYLEKPAACWRTIKKEGCVEENCDNDWAISNVLWKGGKTLKALSYETCSCMFLLLSNHLCVNIKDLDCPFPDPFPHAQLMHSRVVCPLDICVTFVLTVTAILLIHLARLRSTDRESSSR